MTATWNRIGFREYSSGLGLSRDLTSSVLRLMPESPRWLASQHRHEKALAIVKRIAAVNKQNVEDLKHLYTDSEENEPKQSKANILDLFHAPVIMKRTIIIGIVW